MALREQHGAPEGVGPPECDGGCAVHAPRRTHARRALLHRRRRPHLDLQGGDTWLQSCYPRMNTALEPKGQIGQMPDS